MEILILGLLVMAFIACLVLAFPAMAIFATYHAITTGDPDSIPIAIIAWAFTFGLSVALIHKLGDWR
jgi:hypothetical protein